MHIRPGVEDDIPVILNLIRGLAEYEKARPEEVPVEEAALRESLFGVRPAADEFYRSLGAVPMDEWTIFRLIVPAIARLAALLVGVRYSLTK